MAYELLNSAACPAPGRPFAIGRADGAGRVDRPGAIKPIVTNGAGHAR